MSPLLPNRKACAQSDLGPSLARFLFLHWMFAKMLIGALACTSQATTPTPACATCTADMITLTPGDNQDSVTPTLSDIQTGDDGCQHVTATCTAVNGGQTFMQFNVNQGGPINPTGTVVNAPLDCVDGQWVYQQGGQSRVITEINCVNT